MTYSTLDKISAIPFLQTLGIRIKEIGARHAVMEAVVDDRHLNYLGGAHGGLLAAMIDTACFFPRPLVPSGTRLTTVDLNASYVRAARAGDHLTARSELLHLGRRTASVRVTVTDQQDRLIAHGKGTLLILGREAETDGSRGAENSP